MFASYYQYCLSIRFRTCVGGILAVPLCWGVVERGGRGGGRKREPGEERSPSCRQEQLGKRQLQGGKASTAEHSFFLSLWATPWAERAGEKQLKKRPKSPKERKGSALLNSRRRSCAQPNPRGTSTSSKSKNNGRKRRQNQNPLRVFRFQLGQIGERTVLKRQRGRIAVTD